MSIPQGLARRVRLPQLRLVLAGAAWQWSPTKMSRDATIADYFIV
jgi:hypothetical protein